jgi:acyl carrier protein
MTSTTLSERDQLMELVKSILEISDDVRPEDLALGAIPKWDSIKHIQIILEVERQFSIKIPSQWFGKINTFLELADAIHNIKNTHS